MQLMVKVTEKRMTLEKALAIAAVAHAGQLDLAGQEHILHVERVVEAVAEEDKIAAALHDVIEDTAWTILELEAEHGLDATDAGALWYLTKTAEEEADYEAYIERLTTTIRNTANQRALRVKLADATDNHKRSAADNAAKRTAKYAAVIEKVTAALAAYEEE